MPVPVPQPAHHTYSIRVPPRGNQHAGNGEIIADAVAMRRAIKALSSCMSATGGRRCAHGFSSNKKISLFSSSSSG